VEKTSGLHLNPVNGNTPIAFARKVAQLRFLLKDEESKENKFNFVTTRHTVYATLKATQTGNPFCDGLDCWGETLITIITLRPRRSRYVPILTRIGGLPKREYNTK